MQNLLRPEQALSTRNLLSMKNQTKVMPGIKPVGWFLLFMPEGKRFDGLLVTQISSGGKIWIISSWLSGDGSYQAFVARLSKPWFCGEFLDHQAYELYIKFYFISLGSISRPLCSVENCLLWLCPKAQLGNLMKPVSSLGMIFLRRHIDLSLLGKLG